jgi:hypothetical protein
VKEGSKGGRGAGRHGSAVGNGAAVPHAQAFLVERARWNRDCETDATPQRLKEDEAAWVRAMARGLTPDAISVASEKRRAAADAPCYLPKFSVWLDGGCKTDRGKPKANGHAKGNGHWSHRKSKSKNPGDVFLDVVELERGADGTTLREKE